MKYHYKKPEEWVGAGEIYICGHPLYNRCTLFKKNGRGIAVIQEKFNPIKKTRWWSSIEPWIAGDIYLSPGFKEFFEEHASEPDPKGLYPTVTVRKLMWICRLKPLKKEVWEEMI